MRTYLTLLIIFAARVLQAQERYIVYLNGKTSDATAQTISLSPSAIQHRKAQNLGFDIYDVAVNKADIQKLEGAGIHIIRTSRWLNAALVETELTSDGVREVSDNILSVQKISKPLQAINKTSNETLAQSQPDKTANKTTAAKNYGLATSQNLLYNINYLHDKGFTGKGVTVAFLDVGYEGLDTSMFFKKLHQRNGVKATYDFWANDPYVFHKDDHGTICSSLVLADSSGRFVGMATDVDVLLAITDDYFTETHEDEFNYVAALEWADSIGAQIVSASLSYSVFDTGQGNYTYADMDGKTPIVTKGVRIAAAKGMLIVNSAGNAGHLCAPCDADSILCVGGVDSFKAYDTQSSRGPSFDGRVKPDVAALTRGIYSLSYGFIGQWNYGGTSQAAPQITAIAACLKQAYPHASNIDIIEAIKKSAHQYATPDSLIGYGVPDARKADSILQTRFLTIPEISNEDPEFRIYPNPAKDQFVIEGRNNISSVHVSSIMGQTIFRQEMNTPVAVINLGNVAPGTYMVTIIAENNGKSYHRLSVE